MNPNQSAGIVHIPECHHILGQPVSRLAFSFVLFSQALCGFPPFSVCQIGASAGLFRAFPPGFSTLYCSRFSNNSAELLGASTRRTLLLTTACTCVEQTAFVANIGFDASSLESNRDTRTFFRNRESPSRLAWLCRGRPIKDVADAVGAAFALQELTDQLDKAVDVQPNRDAIPMRRHPVQHA